jgi:phage tail sheath protein FI
MLGRREFAAAMSAALMAGAALFVAGIDAQKVVEVRVETRPAAAPEAPFVTATTGPRAHTGQVVWPEQGDVWCAVSAGLTGHLPCQR